ncbi:MAG TPA: hypothetical protein VIL55_10325 [Naasia sp.]|jgi:hypothetical protein
MDTQNRTPGGDDRDLQDQITQDTVNDELEGSDLLPLPDATPVDGDGTNPGGA